MPRYAKPKTSLSVSARTLTLEELVCTAKAEIIKWRDVAHETRLLYEHNASRQASGEWDFATAAKGTRYTMRAAGLYTMRKGLKRMVREALAVRKDGVSGNEMQPVREAMFEQKMKAVAKQLDAIAAFEALPWSARRDPASRIQKSHKQRPAKDTQLATFYEVAKRSEFYEALLIAEFSGVRGKEFASGIRLELHKVNGVPSLRFFIESAKCDGAKKGLDVRCVESMFPADAADDVKRRWLDLAKRASGSKSRVVRIEATAKMTVGQRFTNATKLIARSAGVPVAAYSLRNRFSAQVKESSGGDAVVVALALGHQTTETQRHYARANRGGGGISPTKATGVQMSQTVRGPKTRSGPRMHVKERAALRGAVSAAAQPRPPGIRRL